MKDHKLVNQLKTNVMQTLSESDLKMDCLQFFKHTMI